MAHKSEFIIYWVGGYEYVVTGQPFSILIVGGGDY